MDAERDDAGAPDWEDESGLPQGRFDRLRKTLGLFLGPILLVVLWLRPLPGLDARAQDLVAILGLVVTYWVTEAIPIPVTALLGAALCILFRVSTPQKVLSPFADPMIFLFLGSFILAQAMMVHGLHKRLAFGMLSIRWIGNSSARILFAYGAVSALVSMWISNTATTAMMFPVGLGLAGAVAAILEARSGRRVHPAQLRFGTAMMLMAAYAASAGGIGTPVGTPPNVVGIAMIRRHAGVEIPFFQWMCIAVPILAVLFVVLFFLLYWLHRPELTRIEGGREYVRKEIEKLGRWTPGQRNALVAFLVTASLWVMPGFLALTYGTGSEVYEAYASRMPESLAALIGALLLFVLPTDWRRREFTITWRQAARIDWGTLILFGGGLALGSLMFDTGLAEALGKELLEVTGVRSTWGITLAAIIISIFVSETTSNTAAANVVVPVTISLAAAAGVSPVPPAIGATLGASWGFMLPVATPPNAIVYSSGMVPVTKMVRAGLLFDIAGAAIIWSGLRVLLPLFGLG